MIGTVKISKPPSNEMACKVRNMTPRFSRGPVKTRKRKATQPWFQTRLREKVAQENSFVILYKEKVRSNSPHFSSIFD